MLPMKMTLSGRTAKAIAGFCSTEQSRPVLHDARVIDGNIVATNGHVLVRLPIEAYVECEDRESEDHSHECEKCQGNGLIEADPRESKEWALTTDLLKNPKVSETLEIDLTSGKVCKLDKNGDMVAILPDLVVRDTTYPNTDQVMPHEEPVTRVALNAEYLAILAKLGKALHIDRTGSTRSNNPGIVLETFEKGTHKRGIGIAQYLNGGGRSERIGLIMPLKLEG